jgi:uncharacterized protein YjiS (DUF1127 family)
MVGFAHGYDGRADAQGSAGRSFGLLAALRRWQRRHALHHELMSLDDHLLADIGLKRSDIARIATWAAEEPAAPRRAGVAAKIGQALRRWSDRRRAFAELAALDDRMLADIGIARSDIARTVHGNVSVFALGEALASIVLPPFQRWQRGRLTARTLAKLDDHALADIGIGRSEIGWVAAELAERSVAPANSNARERVA